MTGTELWVVFGKNFVYIATHDIANFLGPGKARAFLVCHAFTVCDTVSFFDGRRMSRMLSLKLLEVFGHDRQAGKGGHLLYTPNICCFDV
jgi:hypothetical protein